MSHIHACCLLLFLLILHIFSKLGLHNQDIAWDLVLRSWFADIFLMSSSYFRGRSCVLWIQQSTWEMPLTKCLSHTWAHAVIVSRLLLSEKTDFSTKKIPMHEHRAWVTTTGLQVTLAMCVTIIQAQEEGDRGVWGWSSHLGVLGSKHKLISRKEHPWLKKYRNGYNNRGASN